MLSNEEIQRRIEERMPQIISENAERRKRFPPGGVMDMPEDDGDLLPADWETRLLGLGKAGPPDEERDERGRWTGGSSRIGVTEDDVPHRAKVPGYDWGKTDLMDIGEHGPVDAARVRRVYGDRDTRAVYQALVPIEEMPAPRLVEDEEGVDPDPETGEERGSYDWSHFNVRGVFPPIKVRVVDNPLTGKPEIQVIDGNHRLQFWEDHGYEYVPAWVVDDRKKAPRLGKVGPVDEPRDDHGRWTATGAIGDSPWKDEGAGGDWVGLWSKRGIGGSVSVSVYVAAAREDERGPKGTGRWISDVEVVDERNQQWNAPVLYHRERTFAERADAEADAAQQRKELDGRQWAEFEDSKPVKKAGPPDEARDDHGRWAGGAGGIYRPKLKYRAGEQINVEGKRGTITAVRGYHVTVTWHDGTETRVNLLREEAQKDFNPDEPRDEHGRWTEGGAVGAAEGPAHHAESLTLKSAADHLLPVVAAWPQGGRRGMARMALVRVGDGERGVALYVGKRLVGVAAYEPHAPGAYGHTLDLSYIATAERGHGVALMREVAQRAATLHAGISLGATDEAEGFYQHLGMHPTHRDGYTSFSWDAEETRRFAQGESMTKAEDDVDHEPESGCFAAPQGRLGKAGFSPDEARDERGRWADDAVEIEVGRAVEEQLRASPQEPSDRIIPRIDRERGLAAVKQRAVERVLAKVRDAAYYYEDAAENLLSQSRAVEAPMPQAVREAFMKAATEVMDNMSPHAAVTLASQLSLIRIYETPDALEAAIGHEDNGGATQGATNRGNGRTYLTASPLPSLRQVMAHEFTHQLDNNAGLLSQSPEWVEAWNHEIRPTSRLSAYAQTEPGEGFAEFGSLVNIDPEKARTRYPRAWAVMRVAGFA